jgi:hypothetical protein
MMSAVALVGGVVVWLAGHAHLFCLYLRQWITIGVDIHSFIQLLLCWTCVVNRALPLRASDAVKGLHAWQQELAWDT